MGPYEHKDGHCGPHRTQPAHVLQVAISTVLQQHQPGMWSPNPPAVSHPLMRLSVQPLEVSEKYETLLMRPSTTIPRVVPPAANCPLPSRPPIMERGIQVGRTTASLGTLTSTISQMLDHPMLQSPSSQLNLPQPLDIVSSDLSRELSWMNGSRGSPFRD